MLAFLLPLASKIVSDAVAKLPENEELGEKLVEICLLILSKAVKLTKTDMDDKLLAVVETIQAREEARRRGAALFYKYTLDITTARRIASCSMGKDRLCR